jgi:hypothetical protein
MFKPLSLSFAAVLLAAGSSIAYAFDYERFFSDSSAFSVATTSGPHAQIGLEGDGFQVTPSGRIDKITAETDMNTYGSTLVGASPLEHASPKSESFENPNRTMNTPYSYSSPVLQPNGECGAPAMSAAEIEALVEQTAQAYGVDPGLAKAIAWVESRFDQTRNSGRGGRGAMQIIARTAVDLGIDDICDPASNIDGGVRHLKRLLDEFRNPVLAVAAYNAGAGAVYAHGGVPPFPETVRYVAAVINHQMGLQMPQTSQVRGPATGSAVPADSARKVMGVRGNRFVKGVMQF